MNPSADLRVRPATAADIPDLLPLVRDYWAFERIEGYDAARLEEPLRRLLGDPRIGAAWVAIDGDSPVGYLLAVYVFSLEHHGITAEIDEFYVRPERRGDGVGDRMLALAEAEFKKAGCTNVSLQVGRGNEAGRRFYLQRGYSPRSGFELLDKDL